MAANSRLFHRKVRPTPHRLSRQLFNFGVGALVQRLVEVGTPNSGDCPLEQNVASATLCATVKRC
jgi:hypothetical protein